MEKDKKVLWLTLGLIFIGMFLLASVFAYGEGKEKSLNTGQVFVSHNYNTYEREIYNYEVKPVNRIYYSQYYTEESRKGFLGDYVKEYSVYVKNQGRTGRYFTVVFEFEDKNGYEFTQAVTQYLRMGESKKFVYKDIQYERNEILNWDYEVIPQKY